MEKIVLRADSEENPFVKIWLDDLLKYGRGLERSDHQLKTVEDHNRTALVNKMQQLRINNNQRRANNSSLHGP
jgi:hypothetical protein